MRLTRLTSPLSPLIDSAPSSYNTDPIQSPQDYADQVKEYILSTMQQQREAVMLQEGQWPAPYPYPPPDDSPQDGYPTQFPSPRRDSDATLAIVIPLIIVLTTLLFLIFLLIILLLRRRRGIELSDEGGPTNLEREDLIDGEGGFEGVESRWLEEVDEGTRIGYQRGKDWQTQYPPNSQPTEITLSQFLSIQEKGVSAWSFEPDYESNPALIVQSRTEITFLSDGAGMAPEEGGGCCVQSNLPLPKLNEVYYWECKMFEKPMGTNISIGLATKPYPSFRLPGWNRFSVGYHSSDGFKSHNFPFTSTSYGPPLLEGDTLGVGYRPRTGTVFFTRNGKKLEDAFIGFNKHNLFPTVGADSACSIHVNLGQAGFVFIEANVKKWGLAPMMGTLAPPPAYGSERGSILLESAAVRAGEGSSNPSPPTRRPPSSSSSSRLLPHAPPSTSSRSRHRNRRLDTPSLPPTAAGAASALASPSQPIRPSPLRHSRHASNLSSTSSSNIPISSPSSHSPSHSAGEEQLAEDEDDGIHNPPTPGLLDISLHSIHRFPNRPEEDDSDSEGERERSEDASESDEEEEEMEPERNLEQRLLREVARERGETDSTRSVSPPAYHPIDPHMYAPGVAETILEDAFSSPSSSSSHPHQHSHSHSSRPQPQTSSTSGSFLAQLGFGSTSGSGSSPGSPAGRGYENRTGSTTRGGQVQSGGAEGHGSWFGWLNGNNQNST